MGATLLQAPPPFLRNRRRQSSSSPACGSRTATLAPRLAMLEKLARALEIDVRDFFSRSKAKRANRRRR